MTMKLCFTFAVIAHLNTNVYLQGIGVKIGPLIGKGLRRHI